MPKKQSIKTGVLDAETDPFLYGRVPAPFTFCVYFAQDDCAVIYEKENIRDDVKRITELTERLIDGLRKMDDCILYAHNGGKFDFHFLLEYANTGTIVIRNGRIFEMRIGKTILRDSWPLMPFALAEYKKQKQDYTIHEIELRHAPKHKKTIVNYVISDCRNLLELLNGFHAIVGDKDTIGAAAFHQIKLLGNKIQTLNEAHDEQFRDYFFGGRVEAVKKGVFNGKFLYVDRNSAYPFAMLQPHAHGSDYMHSGRLPRRQILGSSFIRLSAVSYGAFPLRMHSNSGAPLGVSFPVNSTPRDFTCTGWELLAGLETDTAKIIKIHDVWTPKTLIDLSSYVHKFYKMKADAKAAGNTIAYLAYKYLLNSGYGKFAQNPRDFKDYWLADYGDYVEGYEWECDFGAISLHNRPSYHGRGFYDVATGASITGCTRADLWRGACQSKGLLYMDTDALLCEKTNVKQSNKLGDWKLEGIAKQVLIAGKKLYAVKWNKPQSDGETEKIASKGARLTYAEILEICKGNTVEWNNPAPTFSVKKGVDFISREIRRT